MHAALLCHFPRRKHPFKVKLISYMHTFICTLIFYYYSEYDSIPSLIQIMSTAYSDWIGPGLRSSFGHVNSTFGKLGFFSSFATESQSVYSNCQLSASYAKGGREMQQGCITGAIWLLFCRTAGEKEEDLSVQTPLRYN